MTNLLSFSACLALAGVLLTACSQKSDGTEPVDATSSPDASEEATTSDASVEVLGDPVYLAPLLVSTPVMSGMALPGKRGRGVTDQGEQAYRLGYLRVGQKVLAYSEPHRADNCYEGWYRLVEGGGYVCGKWVTLDLKSSKFRGAPHPPRIDSPLPYDYGANTGQGTPLYRTVPTPEKRLKLEPWRAPKPEPSDDPTADTAAAEGAPATAPAGAVTGQPATTQEGAQEADPSEAPPPASGKQKDKSKIQDAGTPWYLRETDGGKIIVKLNELKERGPIARRMVRGFIVSLDKKFQSGESTWWRTASGLIAPVDRISLQKPKTDFHGVWIRRDPAESAADAGPPPSDAGAEADGSGEPSMDFGTEVASEKTPWVPARPITHMPVGIVVSSYARRYTVKAEKKVAYAIGAAPRFTIVGLTGSTAEIQGRKYHETEDGWWMADQDGVVPEPGPPPDGLLPDEKWIDVNTTKQWLVALKGDHPVFVTLISSGRKDEHNKEKDHRTVTGSFHIREKHISATMDDDSATDGPYSIEDVPWIMYFRRSFALHAAFWHAEFGHQKSHGCVNLAPSDARALFGWTDPKLPDGWHAVFAQSEHAGTRVVVHE